NRRNKIPPSFSSVVGSKADLILSLLRGPRNQLSPLGGRHNYGRSTISSSSSHSRSALPSPAATAVAVSFQELSAEIASGGGAGASERRAAPTTACAED